MISLVVAVAENNVIGNENKLIWHLPADLAFFKRTTMGKTIVMGRKTFQSIGRALPGRKNVVISRDKNFSFENVEVLFDTNEVLLRSKSEDIMVIGGAEIYKIFISVADRIYLTKVHHSFEGDTYFPDLNTNEWKKVSEEPHFKDEKNTFDYSFIVLERMR